jgi:hypothetical protein
MQNVLVAVLRGPNTRRAGSRTCINHRYARQESARKRNNLERLVSHPLFFAFIKASVGAL